MLNRIVVSIFIVLLMFTGCVPDGNINLNMDEPVPLLGLEILNSEVRYGMAPADIIAVYGEPDEAEVREEDLGDGTNIEWYVLTYSLNDLEFNQMEVENLTFIFKDDRLERAACFLLSQDTDHAENRREIKTEISAIYGKPAKEVEYLAEEVKTKSDKEFNEFVNMGGIYAVFWQTSVSELQLSMGIGYIILYCEMLET